MATSLNDVFLIPPIYDAIVDHLSSIDLLRLRRTNRRIHDALLDSRAAWRALSFTSLEPTRPCSCHQRPRAMTGSSYSNLITSRSHLPALDGCGRRAANNQGLDVGTGKTAYLSVDKVLTFIGRTLRLNMYTSLNLSRTMADASLVRNLLDNCPGLVWLGLADCPNIRPYDMLIGLYGLEKAFLQEFRAQRARENTKLAEEKGSAGSNSGSVTPSPYSKRKPPREKIESNSLIVEFMSKPKIEADPSTRIYTNSPEWSEDAFNADDDNNNNNIDNIDSGSARRTPGEELSETAEAASSSSHVQRALPTQVQNELIRMQELTRCLNWSELDALLDNDLIEDAYAAPNLPPSPPQLENRPFKLRHLTLNINLAASKPPMQSWLYTALWKPETYLYLMGYLMEIKIDCACDGPV